MTRVGEKVPQEITKKVSSLFFDETNKPDTFSELGGRTDAMSLRARRNRRHCEPGGRGNLPTLSRGFVLHYDNLIEIAASLRSSQ